jgi:hypothetical protein
MASGSCALPLRSRLMPHVLKGGIANNAAQT